ncbi:MFS transporter [Aeromicrobium senzhongii]|uniref:MFS transporter n=1 Tax=Aeromicrobium senzhongii TaxID=2663859 RepID=UPI00210523BB|nr:MFS transporter [Aeromicrobium senzhongii]
MLRAPGTVPLYLAAFLARIPMMAVPLVLTLLVVEGLGGSYGEAGIVAAVETVGAGLGAPWRGRLIDALGVRRALLPSIAVLFVVYPLATMATYFWLLPLAFVAGLFLAPVHSIVRVSLAANLPTSHHRSAFALDSVMAEASFIIGPAAAGALVVAASPQTALVAVGATVGVGLAILWWLDPPTRSTDEPLAPRVRGFGWVTRDLVFLFLVSAGAMIALMATDLGIIASLRELDAIGLVGVVYLGWGLSSLVGGLVYGMRPASIRPTRLLLVMGLLTMPVGIAHAPWTLALAAIPAGLLCAPIMTACSEYISRLTDEARRGEAMGWQASAFTAGGALGAPLVGTAIDQWGAAAGFAAGGAIAALIALVAIGGQRGPRASSTPGSRVHV